MGRRSGPGRRATGVVAGDHPGWWAGSGDVGWAFVGCRPGWCCGGGVVVGFGPGGGERGRWSPSARRPVHQVVTRVTVLAGVCDGDPHREADHHDHHHVRHHGMSPVRPVSPCWPPVPRWGLFHNHRWVVATPSLGGRGLGGLGGLFAVRHAHTAVAVVVIPVMARIPNPTAARGLTGAPGGARSPRHGGGRSRRR